MAAVTDDESHAEELARPAALRDLAVGAALLLSGGNPFAAGYDAIDLAFALLGLAWVAFAIWRLRRLRLPGTSAGEASPRASARSSGRAARGRDRRHAPPAPRSGTALPGPDRSDARPPAP